MAIASTDIKFRLSGGASNTSPAASLGGAMSTVSGGVITSGQLNNLWDDVSGDEGLAGDTEYRGIYVRNEHATLTLSAIKLWIQSQPSNTDVTFAVAIADEGASVAMETIANESTAPTGPSFTAPTNKTGGITLPDLAPDAYVGIWIRRVVSAEAAASGSDGPTLRVEGDTPA